MITGNKVRNFARYFFGGTAGGSILAYIATSPAVEQALGLLISAVGAAITEWFYIQAKKNGWTL